MGYAIGIRDSEFFIPAERTRDALEAIRELMEDPTADRGGYCKFDGEHFSYVPADTYDEWDYLKEAMRDWRFPVELDEDRNVVDIRFRGEKAGDEEQLFEAIAPYVETGSFIEFFGRGDGYRWRIHFEEDDIRRENDI